MQAKLLYTERDLIKRTQGSSVNCILKTYAFYCVQATPQEEKQSYCEY